MKRVKTLLRPRVVRVAASQQENPFPSCSKQENIDYALGLNSSSRPRRRLIRRERARLREEPGISLRPKSPSSSLAITPKETSKCLGSSASTAATPADPLSPDSSLTPKPNLNPHTPFHATMSFVAPLSTPMTQLFNVKHPVFLAGMNVAAGPEYVPSPPPHAGGSLTRVTLRQTRRCRHQRWRDRSPGRSRLHAQVPQAAD